GTIVRDMELERVAALGREDVNVPVAVPESVLDEVPEGLLEAHAVAVEPSAAAVDLDLPSVVPCAPLEAGGDSLDEHVDVDDFRPQRQDAAVDPGEEQQILGELCQPVDLLSRRP